MGGGSPSSLPLTSPGRKRPRCSSRRRRPQSGRSTALSSTMPTLSAPPAWEWTADDIDMHMEVSNARLYADAASLRRAVAGRTLEEQVSRQFILSDEVDVIIDVADASALGETYT